MTIREIARELKLSPATVSLALSGEGLKYNLSAKTIERVKEFAHQAGYEPNRLAIKLFGKKSDQTIGILFLQGSADDRTIPVLSHAMRYLTENHREFQVYSCHDFYLNPAAYSSTLRYMRSMGIRTIVIIGPLNKNYSMDPKLYENLEVYAMDFDEREMGIPSVFQSVGLCNRKEFHTAMVKSVLAQGRGPILTQNAVRFLVNDWQDSYGIAVEDPEHKEEDPFLCYVNYKACRGLFWWNRCFYGGPFFLTQNLPFP